MTICITILLIIGSFFVGEALGILLMCVLNIEHYNRQECEITRLRRHCVELQRRINETLTERGGGDW